MEILPFLAGPFVASLILTGIHAYLGVHVVERGVIFVDLALAQIAALGATIAILVGMDPHGTRRLLAEPRLHVRGRGHLCLRAHPPRPHSAGSFHRHRLRRGFRYRDSGHEQGHRRNRAPQRHAGRQHSGRVQARGASRPPCSTAWSGCSITSSASKFLLISTDPAESRSPRHEHSLLGFSVLRLVWIRGDFVGGDCRRAAGVLLPDRAVGGRDALRRPRRTTAGHRLDHGHAGFSTWSLLFRVPGHCLPARTIVCTFGGVLILMFLVHLIVLPRARCA